MVVTSVNIYVSEVYKTLSMEKPNMHTCFDCGVICDNDVCDGPEPGNGDSIVQSCTGCLTCNDGIAADVQGVAK